MLIVVLTLCTSAVITFTGYWIYRDKSDERYLTVGENIANTVAALFDGDEAERYLTTLERDAEYERLTALLKLIRNHNDLTYLYVVRFEPDGGHFIFDADDDPENSSLGMVQSWKEGFGVRITEEEKHRFYDGAAIPPRVYSSAFYGTLFTVYQPLLRANGDIKNGYYVGSDFALKLIGGKHYEYFSVLSILGLLSAVLFSLLHWLLVRRSVLLPIRRLADAAQAYLITDDAGKLTHTPMFTHIKLYANDEIKILADSLITLEHRIENHISQLTEAQRKASTDSLTQLHNREVFFNHVQAVLNNRRNRELNKVHAFVVLDIDKFKDINDTYGHLVGDDVLRQCANVLTTLFRRSDEIGRIGGDEFTVFCANMRDHTIIKRKAEQTREALACIHPVPNAPPVTASIGIAIVGTDTSCDYDTLFQQADQALYQVKKRGRDGFAVVEIEHQPSGESV